MDGKKLRAIRKQLGLTQVQFAERLGVTSTAVAYWERGERPIGEPVARLASILATGKVILNVDGSIENADWIKKTKKGGKR